MEFVKMNKYEQACKEWLKDCSCAQQNKPELCKEYTKAFLCHVKQLGGNSLKQNGGNQ